MKKMVIGIIIGIALAGTTGILADSIVELMEVSYSINGIYVNGNDTEKHGRAFISKGVTYVPLRDVTDLLGATIEWDSKTKNIYIEEKKKPSSLDINLDENSEYVKLLSQEDAEIMALIKVGGGEVLYSKFDIIDNLQVYDIEIKYMGEHYKTLVDATTGSVFYLERVNEVVD